MPPSPSFQCFTLVLLALPAVILLVYFLTAFPHVPEPLTIHSSLASLPKDCRSWQIYPEDIFPGGLYVSFPYGRVRYWLFGPEDGVKVRGHYCVYLRKKAIDVVATSRVACPDTRLVRAVSDLAECRSSARCQGLPNPRVWYGCSSLHTLTMFLHDCIHRSLRSRIHGRPADNVRPFAVYDPTCTPPPTRWLASSLREPRRRLYGWRCCNRLRCAISLPRDRTDRAHSHDWHCRLERYVPYVTVSK